MRILGPEQWGEILRDYGAGATQRDLARKWGVSVSTISRRALRAKCAKRAICAPVDAASALENPATEAPRPPTGNAYRDSLTPNDGTPDLVLDVMQGEQHEPGFLVRMAVSASGQALRAYEYDEARTLAKLAEQYARIADRGRRTNLHTVLRAMTDKPFAEELFTREEGERNLVKEIFWEVMGKVDAMTADNAASRAQTPPDAH